MKTRNEIAQLLKDALEGQDTDAIWFAIGELEKNDADKSDTLIKHYKESLKTYEDYASKSEESGSEEDFEDTLGRKYEEGFSDALAMALRVLDGSDI